MRANCSEKDSCLPFTLLNYHLRVSYTYVHIIGLDVELTVTESANMS